MRDIKFRAWDKEKNKMIYSDETYPRNVYKFDFEILKDYKFTLNKMTDRFNVVDEEGDDYYIETYSPVDADTMQYTGLKDKNGKEIYEGDILSYKHIVYTDCSKTEIKEIEDEAFIEIINYAPIASVVKAHSENVKCFGHDTINNQFLIIDLKSDEVEVIGNIYENPDLLKEIDDEK